MEWNGNSMEWHSVRFLARTVGRQLHVDGNSKALEIFNYRYSAFKACCLLAALDNDHHISRDQAIVQSTRAKIPQELQ